MRSTQPKIPTGLCSSLKLLPSLWIRFTNSGNNNPDSQSIALATFSQAPSGTSIIRSSRICSLTIPGVCTFFSHPLRVSSRLQPPNPCSLMLPGPQPESHVLLCNRRTPPSASQHQRERERETVQQSLHRTPSGHPEISRDTMSRPLNGQLKCLTKLINPTTFGLGTKPLTN